ncbi:rhodopsin, GQ-coupled-like [Asterias rubens]|uniref:rhodopsin, GQ-coupled-like n=1 Tax=Asterias rubens TaxID=7604 RepID=UPI001454F85D|nr:rhodopsin, GQ-coupled-like [Asterias rubens]XP_033633741.1 rhodopsin, GQ-coupled-like [Asterias rubens]
MASTVDTLSMFSANATNDNATTLEFTTEGVSSNDDMTSLNDTMDVMGFVFDDMVQRYIIGVVFCLVSLFGFTGNTIVILAVVLSNKLQTRTNVFVVNLATADLLTCLASPFNAVALFSLNGWPLPEIICSLSGALFIVSLSCSITSLACISINRLILITKTLSTYQSIYTSKKIAAMIVFTWLYPLLICCLPLFGIGRWGYSFKFKICTQDSNVETSRTFSLIGALLVYPIPLLILFVCYFKIYRHVDAHIRTLTQKRASEVEMHDEPSTSSSRATPTSSSRATPSSPKSPKPTLKRSATQASLSRRQTAITKNLFFVMCAFIACLAPYAVSLVIRNSDPVVPWTFMIVIFNSAINPVIYGIKHPHFKKVFLHMFRCQYHQIPEPSNFLKRLSKR